MVSKVVEQRAALIQNEGAVLERLNEATDRLVELNPGIKDLKEGVSKEPRPEDLLTKVANFVLAAEKTGSIADEQKRVAEVRRQARAIKAEALELQGQMEGFKRSIKQLQDVYDQRVANTERIRDLSKAKT